MGSCEQAEAQGSGRLIVGKLFNKTFRQKGGQRDMEGGYRGQRGRI